MRKKLLNIKNDFISNISHELKTPLATVSAAIEAMQSYQLDEEKQKRYLLHARTEVSKLQYMIENILQVFAEGESKTKLEMVDIPAYATINAIIDQLRLTSGK